MLEAAQIWLILNITVCLEELLHYFGAGGKIQPRNYNPLLLTVFNLMGVLYFCLPVAPGRQRNLGLLTLRMLISELLLVVWIDDLEFLDPILFLFNSTVKEPLFFKEFFFICVKMEWRPVLILEMCFSLVALLPSRHHQLLGSVLFIVEGLLTQQLILLIAECQIFFNRVDQHPVVVQVIRQDSLLKHGSIRKLCTTAIEVFQSQMIQPIRLPQHSLLLSQRTLELVGFETSTRISIRG